ncbi:MAG: hypothetical protein Ct9H90mP14_0220 [Methanobacteriota archaeon]|nr:MAG: hypothetical protein Ct9H90mP14_0220 [Euryarchaeota archaeon]
MPIFEIRLMVSDSVMVLLPRRALVCGIGGLLQIGIRAYSLDEAKFAETDDRIETFYAQDLFSPSAGMTIWNSLIERISQLSGPIWLNFDIDGLDGSLVPDTGTPVPGGSDSLGCGGNYRRVFCQTT